MNRHVAYRLLKFHRAHRSVIHLGLLIFIAVCLMVGAEGRANFAFVLLGALCEVK